MEPGLGIVWVLVDRAAQQCLGLGRIGRARRLGQQDQRLDVIGEFGEHRAARGLGHRGPAEPELRPGVENRPVGARDAGHRFGTLRGRRCLRTRGAVTVLVALPAAAGARVVARAWCDDHRLEARTCASASASCAITAPHSPIRGWRNKRAVGYHGVSVRPRNHRQSGAKGSRIHTGRASAPAR
jgi:hypothetical protein